MSTNEILFRATPSAEIDLDPDIKELLEPVITRWELTAARIAAGFGDPQPSFPLNGGHTPEDVLKARFDVLPGGVKIASRTRALREIGHPRTLKRVSRILNVGNVDGRVDFPANATVSTANSPVPKVITGKDLKDMAKDWLNDLGLPPVSGPLPFHQSRLDLNLVRVHCSDETDGFLGIEAGMDEIEIGGQAIDPMKLDLTQQDFGLAGATTTLNAYRLPWKFNDGTEHTFRRPHTLHTFDLRGLNEFPANYVVTLIMAEVDSGSFQSTLERILKGVEKETVERLTAAIGSIVGTPGGIAGAIIGAAVGYAVGKVFRYITGLFDDVVFDAVTLEVTIPSANATVPTPSSVVHFRGPGHYVVRYDWQFS